MGKKSREGEEASRERGRAGKGEPEGGYKHLGCLGLEESKHGSAMEAPMLAAHVLQRKKKGRGDSAYN